MRSLAVLAACTAMAGPVWSSGIEIEVAGAANGTIAIDLLEDVAPNHVEQITALAEEGFYDGVYFHRVITGFMAQTGDGQYAKVEGGNLRRAGTGGSERPDLAAELLCGTWTVRDEVEVAADGLFEMRGVLVVARNSRRRDVTVGTNATLRIEGDLTIYGDLVLEEGASLEFLGNTARVNIFGDVLMDDSATVTGEFDDVQDKF